MIECIPKEGDLFPHLSSDNNFSFADIREVSKQKYYAIKVSFGNQWLCLLGYPVEDINSALLFRDRKEAQDFIDTACYKIARYMLSVVEVDSSELSPE